MSGIKALLVSSTLGASGLAVVDPMTAGATLGRATPSVILGIVSVACVIALVRLYRDKAQADRDSRMAHDANLARLMTLVESNIAANQKTADAVERVTAVTEEATRAIALCSATQAARRG